MKPNTKSLEEIISDESIVALQNEMSLVYWRLNNMKAYEKAGSKFDEGDWGLALSVFTLGYLNGYIQKRLDPDEMILHKSIYQLAESKYFRGGWGDKSEEVFHLCWTRITENEQYQLFYKMGQVASGNENGIVKDVVLMFSTIYLFEKND